MTRIVRFEKSSERLLRAVSSSPAVLFGSDAPHAFGRVGFTSIGYADIPAVAVTLYAKVADFQSCLVPVVRQKILTAVEELNLPTVGIALRVSWGVRARKRKYVDGNPSSPSYGKWKFGNVIECHLEIDHPGVVKALRAGMPRWYS